MFGSMGPGASQVRRYRGLARGHVYKNRDDPNGKEVVGIEIGAPPNGRRTLKARYVVLACGGLETPRLMLASRDHRSCGIGNEHDNVGRYFMTHISGISGLIRFAGTAIDREFDYKERFDGIYVRRLILLSPEAMRRTESETLLFVLTFTPSLMHLMGIQSYRRCSWPSVSSFLSMQES